MRSFPSEARDNTPKKGLRLWNYFEEEQVLESLGTSDWALRVWLEVALELVA